MTDGLLTADGRSASSIQVLASLCGCHRDQIRVWRREGAPADLDLRAWHVWLDGTRRWTYAAKLGAILPDLDPAPPPAGDQAPAAPGKASESKDDADRRFAIARADRAQLELDEMEGRLVERALLERAVARLAAITVDRLNRGIWDAIVPALDAATPDTRRACRQAHDAAILALRAELGAPAVRQVLADVLVKPT